MRAFLAFVAVMLASSEAAAQNPNVLVWPYFQGYYQPVYQPAYYLPMYYQSAQDWQSYGFRYYQVVPVYNFGFAMPQMSVYPIRYMGPRW